MALGRLCNRAIWLDHGRIKEVGPVEHAVAAYKAHSKAQTAATADGQTAAA